nr:TIR domain-containing protein [Adonisia turfae]
MTQYKLRLAYQRPKEDRLRRIAVVKPRNNDIFISYTPQDGDFVRRLDQAIRDQGLDPWIDFDDIPDFNHFLDGDSTYEKQIKDGILGADVFVLVLSNAALGNGRIMQGLRLAQRLNKLIVLLYQNSFADIHELTLSLDDLQYLDLNSPLVGKVFEQVACNIIHLQTYTRLLARANEWDKQGRPQSYLLTLEDLKEVKKQKRWIETHKLGAQFKFTKIQKVFLETVDRAHETSEYFSKSPPDIFISYSRSNKHFVEKLNQSLKDERWKVWIDRDRIPVAANWRDEAEEGIRYAHTVIFVVCPDSLTSKNCQWEFEKAKKYKKRIIPVISCNDYNREVFQAMGLSSVQYVSFVRHGQSFDQSLQQLLDALKTNLDDLKVYRQVLVKAYEWSDRERSDRFLMGRHEFKEVQGWRRKRQYLQQTDNREVDLLLPRQHEYIQASQRYLALQRKRQWVMISAILGIFAGLSTLLLATTFSEIKALVKSLDNLKGLDALVTGLQAGERVNHHYLFVRLLRPDLQAKATTVLHRTALNLSEINRLEGHDGKVYSVVFSPDSQQLVSVSVDETVRFWGLRKETDDQGESCSQNATRFNIDKGGIPSKAFRTVSYSSYGSDIATGDEDGTIKLWGCTGQLTKVLSQSHRDRVNRIAFSPGGQYLASAGKDGQVFLWTRYDGFSTLINFEYQGKAPVSTLVFSPNGKYLAAADAQGLVHLWEISHNPEGLPFVRLINTFLYEVPENLRYLITLVFSPDSSLLAFSGYGGVVQVQSLKQATVRRLADHDGDVYQIVFSSDGRTLASASFDGTVKLWNPRGKEGKELVHTLRGHQGPVYRVVFGPQDDVLATGGADGIVRLWLRDKGVQIEAFEGHEDEISSLAFSPKATLGYASVLASASDSGDIRLWNIDSPIQPLPHNSDVYDVTLRPDGRMIASGGRKTVRVWRPDGTPRFHIAFGQDSKVLAVDYSPDGRILAAGGSNGQIRLWKPDFDTEKPIQVLDAHSDPMDEESSSEEVLDLAFSPDGQWLASVGTDRTLKLWRFEGEQLYRYVTLEHSNDVTGVAFSQNNQQLVTSTRAESDAVGRGIYLWQMPKKGILGEKPKLQLLTEEKHEGSVLTVAIQPAKDGIIASGGKDGKINLWSASGELIRTLNEHTDPVTKVSFSGDGLFLASSSQDGSVRLWTAQGDLISVLERHKRAVSSVEFAPKNSDLSPNGNEFIVSSSSDEDVLLWELWDLSKLEINERNQNRALLKMLISNGCRPAMPFLESRYSKDTQQNIAEMNTSERESLGEIKKIKEFCDRILPNKKSESR